VNHATKIPWETKVKGSRYGTDDTYRMAAMWLKGCMVVADWGGAQGHFRQFLPKHARYRLVDGTKQVEGTVVADLATYTEPSDGILLRHVLEMTDDWRQVLQNAVNAFQYRMVVVTFTPHVPKTKVVTHHLTWPVYHFNHDEDLIPLMQPFIKKVVDGTWKDEHFRKSIPERVYYLERE